MKNSFILIALFLFCTQLLAQTPTAVQNTFKKKYPNATAVEWEAEADGTYEAAFKLNKKHMAAIFDAKGTWLETETAIKPKKLPKAVQAGIAATFPGFEIDEAEKIEKPDGTIEYEVEVEKEDGKDEVEYEALFSAAGKLLKKTKEDDDDSDEKDD